MSQQRVISSRGSRDSTDQIKRLVHSLPPGRRHQHRGRGGQGGLSSHHARPQHRRQHHRLHGLRGLSGRNRRQVVLC